MQGRPEIIELLNEVLTAELTAVNQYFGHSKMQKDWGYRRLAEHAYHESIDEMKHADWLETQLDLVAKLGEQLYLSEQMGD